MPVSYRPLINRFLYISNKHAERTTKHATGNFVFCIMEYFAACSSFGWIIKLNHVNKKTCLFILKSTLINAEVLKFRSYSVAICYLIVIVTNKHVKWQSSLIILLSLLSSRVGPMRRSQIQVRRLPITGSSTVYSCKLSFKKFF